MLALVLCLAHPAPVVVPHARGVEVRRTGTQYRARSTLRFTVGLPGALPSDVAERNHALGHVRIAQRFVASAAETVTALGTDARGARRRLAQALRRATSDAQAELMREESFYDRVTDDGRRQDEGSAFGFPGGPNVTAACRGSSP